MSDEAGGDLLDFAPREAVSGFRLLRLELFNWGTFHEHVWTLNARCHNTLVTGDIGSGKSTLVDAVTTLLVPPQRQQYNKAAGAEARERTPRSYFLGYYKAERADVGSASRPVALRDRNSYSVLLACFANDALQQQVTVAQVFWMDSPEGQPERLYLVADTPLSIREHFGGFGSEIGGLKKRLRKLKVELFDSFPPYSAAFRRRFGISSDQALELFQQTVSMKSVGNLTDFVREHMLEAFQVQERIDALLSHYDALQRAHEAVLVAKAQVAQLEPLVASCDEHEAVARQLEEEKACRVALPSWFAGVRLLLLRARMARLEAECAGLKGMIAELKDRHGRDEDKRDDLKREMGRAGGDRIEQIKAEIKQKRVLQASREESAKRYESIAEKVELPPPRDAESFVTNQRLAVESEGVTSARINELQESSTELAVALEQLRISHRDIKEEIVSLRTRTSNIPKRILEVRTSLCAALCLEEAALPFAGELLQVRPKQAKWEGAIERLLHSFGTSLLVAEANYAAVSAWVDKTHLNQRLMYYNVREGLGDGARFSAESIVAKLEIQPESRFYAWLEVELGRRYPHVCCDTLEQLRRESFAITRAGQIKSGGVRHEKDDRHAINDRKRYILGWSNERKIAALDKDLRALEIRIAQKEAEVAERKRSLDLLRGKRDGLLQLAMFQSFQELDWRALVSAIKEMEDEVRRLTASSDVLRTLQEQLTSLGREMAERVKTIEQRSVQLTEDEFIRERDREQAGVCEELLAQLPEAERVLRFPALETMAREVLGAHTPILEACAESERVLMNWLLARIEEKSQRQGALVQSVVRAMQAYRNDYPKETREVDSRVEAAGEYRAMLQKLESDDLPSFESRFRQLLEENTLREIAGFQSELRRERDSIKDRISRINQSLRAIEYNPGRYIELQHAEAADVEVREFRKELRACTEGALSGSGDTAYAEEKFEQVKRIIERLKGRAIYSEVDRRWTRKVTDVRNWFTFSASERYREGDAEHEHNADSGGKSGGQKEKLAYTVLAASLAYQFGLEPGRTQPRTFRFVVIDEAFGRGSDESARYALELFQRLGLQLLIVTPLQKIQVIEPFVAAVGFVHNEGGLSSRLRNLTIEEYRAERAARAG